MESFKEFLVFSLDYQSKIAFYSPENVERSFTIDVDWNFPINGQKPKMFLESANEENSKQIYESPEKCIHNIAVAENSNLMAFTGSDKTLFLCEIQGSSCKILSRRIFLRTGSCIRFSEKLLYLADKTGDVFEYLCDEENYEKPGRWIFGHISQILDLQVSPNSKYIITSDRDEKIRVTNSPAYHEIESYCLGHKQFVSSLFVLSDDLLLSISGDETLRLWNFLSGKQLYSTKFDFTPILFKHVKLSSSEGMLCISTSDYAVKIYEYQLIDNSALKLHLMGEKKYSSDLEIAVSNQKFYVEFIEEVEGSKRGFIDEIKIDGKTASFNTLKEDILKVLNIDNLPLKIFKSFDVSILFKNCGKYDNVKEYIDRKKARIESQAMKKK